MKKEKQNISNNNNDKCSYSEEIVSQYVMQLPTFDSKKLKPNQQRRKKVLKPIRTHTSDNRQQQCPINTPHQTTYTSRTGTHSKTSNVNNLLSKDQIFRIKQLENELVEARTKIKDLITENRWLKTVEKRHENALSMYEGEKAKLPQIIASYKEDIRMLQSQIRQIKMSYKEMEKRYKSQSTELMVLQKQHRHLVCLSKNKELNKREELSAQLEKAQDIIKQQDEKLQNFAKQLELQNKTHRTHILNLENNKVKQLKYEKEKLKNENNNLKLNLDKLKTNRYGVREIFGQGITENSIRINRLKLEPKIQGQGDETDKFVYKMNESISLKSESLQDEYCMDSIRHRKKSEHIKTQSPSSINKKLFSSNESSRILWLNEDQTKLTKKNKPKLSIIENNNNFENQNEPKFKTSNTIPESSMSRMKKDLLLTKLSQVTDNNNDYESSYNLKSVNNRYSSLNSNDVSRKSLFSD